MLDESTEKAS